MDVFFSFELQGGQTLTDLFKINLPSNIPEVGETIRFKKSEAGLLESNDFPIEVWRVRSKQYEIGDGQIERITLVMELRNVRRLRENAEIEHIAAEVKKALGS